MGKIKTILGDNIRSLRTNKGWTQLYLSDCLQITAPFLAQIESGKRGMSLELIEAVADLFEIPIASLFIEPGKKTAKTSATIRNMEVQIIEKQLQEIVSESIAKAFKKLK